MSILSRCSQVIFGGPTMACPGEWVNTRASLMSSSLLLQLYSTCLVNLIWMVLEMEGRWLYICCFVGCYFQDLFNIACNILMHFPSSFFSICFVSVHMVHPYNRINTNAAWKKFCFILSVRLGFHVINRLSIAVHAFAQCILMSLFSRWGTVYHKSEYTPHISADI